MNTLIIILVTICTTQALLPEELDHEWAKFKLTHWKRGFDPQEHLRKSIFAGNLETIIEHNERFSQGLETYEMGLNKLSDRTEEEIGLNTGLNSTLEDTESLINYTKTKHDLFRVGIPAAVDWKQMGFVTPVKSQRACGSCWAFAAVGALEAQLKIRRGVTAILSEQQLVDCVPDSSCRGGYTQNAYSYIQRNGGINYSNYYRYEARDNKCRYNRNRPKVTIRGYQVPVRNNEEALRRAVATQGPIAVYIHVDTRTFNNYKSGVYYLPGCSNSINHAVVVVGYGRENGQDYWLVKNSWGANWGLGGYIKMARNRGNNCGIAAFGLYPVL